MLTHTKEDFTFITKHALRVGELVCYQSGNHRVLSRITGTEPLKHYPPEFLYDSELDTSEIAAFCGLDTEDYQYYLASAVVIGYFDHVRGEFVNPRVKPLPGTSVETADSQVLSDVNKVAYGDVGSLHIGTIMGTDSEVVLSTKELVSQHLSIIASTGAGKSYTVGVIVEELMSPNNRASVLIFDPHGEYSVLSEIQNNREFWSEKYRPRVKIIKPHQIKIRVGDLNLDDFISILDDGTLSEKMKTLFRTAYRNLRREEEKRLRVFTKNELQESIKELRDGTNESSIDGILWRYRRISEEHMFDDYQTIPLRDYFQPGQLTIMDVSGTGTWKQQLIASILLRHIFDAREGTDNQRYSEEQRPERYIPYPVFVILEEAHRFAPQSREAKSKHILKTLLSEGRKFGVGIAMVSQRPSKLDADSLSQCMTQITMRIINPSDQKQIAQSIESVSRDLIEELPALSRGQAIISGVAINTPVTANIRKRRTTQIRGESKDAPRLWLQAQQEQQRESMPKMQPSYDVDIGV